MPISRHQIIGHRLRGVMQTYAFVDNWLDQVENFFLLENGIAFCLPAFSDSGLEPISIPPSAGAIAHPLLARATQSPICEMYRPKNEDEWYPDSVWLRTESGIWIGEVTTAPHGTGGAGVYINEHAPGDADQLEPFWPPAVA